jgi:acyl carrier protein
MESEIRGRCTDYLAKLLNRPAKLIDPHAKFARLGVDSAKSVFLLMELEEWLAIELPTDIIFEYPTIAQLAQHIARYRASETARGHRRG